jgi:type III pantothenate kinase
MNSPAHVDDLLKEYPSIDKVILSAVKDYSPELKSMLQKRFHSFIELDATTPLPIENLYQTKETLGKDRLAGLCGSIHLYPGNQCTGD